MLTSLHSVALVGRNDIYNIICLSASKHKYTHTLTQICIIRAHPYLCVFVNRQVFSEQLGLLILQVQKPGGYFFVTSRVETFDNLIFEHQCTLL